MRGACSSRKNPLSQRKRSQLSQGRAIWFVGRPLVARCCEEQYSTFVPYLQGEHREKLHHLARCAILNITCPERGETSRTEENSRRKGTMKMKRGSFVVKLVFGILGAGYAVLGSVFLAVAIGAAGDIRRIFTLPEKELTFAILGTVFTALGVVFLLVTVLLLLSGRTQNRLREELLTYGTRVTGTVTDVWINYSIRVNRHSPLIAKVQCSFPTGEVTLKSKNLWSACPSTGDQVEVIYDPMDERRYVIEFPGEK